MGLDLVELVMEFEDEFAISIPDEAAEHICTVRDAVDFIVSELRARKAPVREGQCLSAARFRVIRDDLHISFGVSRRSIRPSAKVAELIPPGPVRARWSEFARAHALPKSPVSFFPLMRFPEAQTTLRELVLAVRPGDYTRSDGEIDHDRILRKVREIVSEQAGVKVEQVREETRFIDDLHLG